MHAAHNPACELPGAACVAGTAASTAASTAVAIPTAHTLPLQLLRPFFALILMGGAGMGLLQLLAVLLLVLLLVLR